MLIAATSFDQHLEQLARSLADASTERRPFIQAFVRPLGLNVAATPRFVDEVESLQSVSVTAPPRLAFRMAGTPMARHGDRLSRRREPRALGLLRPRARKDRAGARA
jgi:hypothetical protein